MTVKKKKPVKLTNRHTFKFKLDGAEKPFAAPATVRSAKAKVELALTEDHVLRALELNGQGNTQNCAGAVCSRDHADVLGHKAFYVDWFFSRVYICNKVKASGFPAECIVYRHNDDVAKKFDTSTGMKKLLADIRRRGPRIVTLYPVETGSHKRKAKNAAHRGSKEDGSRVKARPASTLRGGNLRFARMSGGVA